MGDESVTSAMEELMTERGWSDADDLVMKETWLTTGVRVLLPLLDQFTEDGLRDFLANLKASCLELRRFEEEQMMLKMPTFELPVVEVEEGGGEEAEGQVKE